MQVIFTPRALQHIENLHAYLTDQASELTADRYVGRIVAYCQRLDVFPLRGTRRDDIIPGLRIIGFEHRVNIAFIATAETVLIEGVFYGGQDYEASFREPE
ncbi:type II toxin-antitoxin system RelE/ParE family toxin [Bosea caraganae]|uniref:Type II toxin-antitoxin system RelE/ParE family toxin n=1 Tax=Bosea caraganae TaxID=2763117 RepID=A0A370L7I0_9HYPH|nr:type II toxin-antitoxin system RelE/ParE family toxin [Bosea caraganae]RDJ25014.1 type II toxin-antitoxin system RelE/ParE family toxin [Bosea caraganae]RDJ26124.1 type II toxin-antitoxin system RelE/ParE family toxin [Bosea caraganae]